MLKNKTKPHKLRNVILIFLLLVSLVTGSTLVYYKRNLKAVNLLDKTTKTVVVSKESTASTVAQTLKQDKLIRSDKVFMIYLRLHKLGGSLQAGSYNLSPSLSVEEIVYRLTAGIVAKEYFTILPARTEADIRQDMIRAGFSEEDVAAAFESDLYKNNELFKNAPPGSVLEGYLYPDSYEIDSTTTPRQIIENAMNELTLVYNQQIASATKTNLSSHEIITLASIVENEASDITNRKKIAAVFYNRLEAGMNLGSDVTAFYGSKINGQPLSVNYDSLYNTRLYNGLPPGPISAVSSSSLSAVMQPDKNSYYYFVAGDDGTVHYANSLAEHESNVSRYCTSACQ